MGKLHLTMDELEQFPTIENLIKWGEKKDPNLWGLCQNDNGDVTFREGGGSWLLQVSLNEIYERTHITFGECYSPDDILLFYCIDCSGANDIYFDLIEISSYKELIQTYPRDDWAMFIES